MYTNSLEISGDPAGNRIQMTGLEDAIRAVCLCSEDVSRCRCSEVTQARASMATRQVVGIVGGLHQVRPRLHHPIKETWPPRASERALQKRMLMWTLAGCDTRHDPILCHPRSHHGETRRSASTRHGGRSGDSVASVLVSCGISITLASACPEVVLGFLPQRFVLPLTGTSCPSYTPVQSVCKES
jgi:hypothetical protein